MNDAKQRLREALRWTLDNSSDPAFAAADWMARDIRPTAVGALELLTSSDISLDEVARAKDAFKTMCVVGDTADDRRLGAKLYALAIGAGLVRFDERVSRQSDRALRRGLQAVLDDDATMNETARQLARAAMNHLDPAPDAPDESPA